VEDLKARFSEEKKIIKEILKVGVDLCIFIQQGGERHCEESSVLLEPRLLDLEMTALTMRPPCLILTTGNLLVFGHFQSMLIAH